MGVERIGYENQIASDSIMTCVRVCPTGPWQRSTAMSVEHVEQGCLSR